MRSVFIKTPQEHITEIEKKEFGLLGYKPLTPTIAKSSNKHTHKNHSNKPQWKKKVQI